MSPKKLTEDDKQEILQLYQQTEATTSTLATRYDVSSSTISRFLKNNLPAPKYEELIRQKRLANPAKRDNQSSTRPSPKPSQTELPLSFEQPSKQDDDQNDNQENTISIRRRRRRSSATTETDQTTFIAAEVAESETNPPAEIKQTDILEAVKEEILPAAEFEPLEVITLREMLGEDVLDLDEDEDEDEDEDDLDALDDEDWDVESESELSYGRAGVSNLDVEILPLAAASFPRTCYLVIDRTSELITRPLADFADLGMIPAGEIRQKTLPVFDNHRVARRFSHRRERVIKVPDGRMLQKTSQYLQAKGITRLLIDGQVYSLS